MPREVRTPSADDLAKLAAIEEASDRLFVDLVGPELFGPSEPGAVRAGMPGFILVAAEFPGGDPIGFVHVLEVDGFAHLEQLSVLPDHGRRGHGRALVEAAKDAAKEREHRAITLRTYVNVPWNQPFYETLGFTPIAPIEHPFYEGLIQVETDLGLFEHGDRVLMRAEL